MSQTKYKMSKNIKYSMMWLCREYETALKWLQNERSRVWDSSTVPDGLPKGNAISHQTEDRAIKLQIIEESFQNKLVQAIDQAKLHIGNDIANDELVQKLREAIWESTLDGRQFPYEVWDLPTIYRDDFYERKRKFILDIAKNMKLM